MNKTEFLQTLEQTLSEIKVSDKADILYDYEEHFRIGEENGKTEDELITELGDPRNIAKQYENPFQIEPKEQISNFETKQASASASASINYSATQVPVNQGTLQTPIFVSFIAASALLLFNLIFIVGPYFAVLGVLIGLFAGALGITVAGIGMALGLIFAPFSPEFMSVVNSFSTVTLLSLGVGTTALGLILMIGMCYLTKYFYLGTVKYIKWNIKIIKG